MYQSYINKIEDDALYHSVSATINELTSDTKYLGAKVGYICVLHSSSVSNVDTSDHSNVNNSQRALKRRRSYLQLFLL